MRITQELEIKYKVKLGWSRAQASFQGSALICQMEIHTNNGQPHYACANPTVPRKRSRSLYRISSNAERCQLRQSVETDKRSAIQKASQKRSGMMISCCRPSCTIGSSLNVSELSAASPICMASHPDWIIRSRALEVGRKRPASNDGLVIPKVKVICPSEVVVNLVLRRSVDSHQSLRLQNSREAVTEKGGCPAEKRSGDVVQQSKFNCNYVMLVGLRSFDLFWFTF